MTQAQSEWFRELNDLAEKREYKVTIFRTVLRASKRKGESGRRLSVLDPWEADRLYKLIHRGQFAVFQCGSARVQLNPLNILSSATSTSLERVVRYKAYFAQFDGSTGPEALFKQFDDWRDTVHIETHRDCRVLPLHMFAPKRDWTELEPIDGRAEFEKVHGRPSQLQDEAARPWKQPSALHGRDSLFIANFVLPQGFHWDVDAAVNESRLASLVELWKFPPGSYANVSPDGHIRGGQRSGVSARREGAAPRPPESEQSPSESKRRNSSRRRQRSRFK